MPALARVVPADARSAPADARSSGQGSKGNPSVRLLAQERSATLSWQLAVPSFTTRCLLCSMLAGVEPGTRGAGPAGLLLDTAVRGDGRAGGQAARGVRAASRAARTCHRLRRAQRSEQI